MIIVLSVNRLDVVAKLDYGLKAHAHGKWALYELQTKLGNIKEIFNKDTYLEYKYL